MKDTVSPAIRPRFRRLSRVGSVLVVLLSAACEPPTSVLPPSAAHPTAASLPSDLLIKLERTQCDGSCPSYVVAIDAAGGVTWSGRDFVDCVGERHAQVPLSSVASLVARFDAMHFDVL